MEKKGAKKNKAMIAAPWQGSEPYSSTRMGIKEAEGNRHTQGSVKAVPGFRSRTFQLSQRRQERHHSSRCSWLFLFIQLPCTSLHLQSCNSDGFQL